MASTPEERHYPQTAEPAGLPASMVNAVRLMYAGAGIAVVLGVTIALTTHTRTVHMGDPASGTYKAGYVIGGVISFAKSDRGCSRVWTAVRGPDHDQCL